MLTVFRLETEGLLRVKVGIWAWLYKGLLSLALGTFNTLNWSLLKSAA